MSRKCGLDIIDEELKVLAEEIVIDKEMKKVLIKFINHHLNKESHTSLSIKTTVIGILFLLISMKNQRLLDINWKLICTLHHKFNFMEEVDLYKNNYLNKKYINQYTQEFYKTYYKAQYTLGSNKFYRILRDYYLYLNEEQLGNVYPNIRGIMEYKHLLLIDQPAKGKRNILQEEYGYILNDYPLDSSYDCMIQIRLNKSEGTVFYTNYNINTKNVVVKQILTQFINQSQNEAFIRNSFLKLFMHFFDKSLHGSVIRDEQDFNENLFVKQYSFYSNLYNKLSPKIKMENRYNYKTILVNFYRFLINKLKEKGMKPLFSKQFQQIIYIKSFYKYYEEGYEWVYYSRLETPPSMDKICILPSLGEATITNNSTISYLSIDLTHVPPKYKDDIRNFIWYSTGGLNNKVNALRYLIEFHKYNVLYEKEDTVYNSQISCSREDKVFTQNFLWDYRVYVESNNSKGNLKSIFKIVRKYMKYYSEKYNVGQNDLEILSLKGLAVFDGGNPITEHDCKVLYKEFLRIESEKGVNKLYTIIFEIFMFSNLRLREILNLERDCLKYIDEIELTIELRYKSKTSDGQYVVKKISKKIAALIEKAKQLTEEVAFHDDPLFKYIFVKPYDAQYVKKNKILDFYTYFTKVLKSVAEELENTDYSPYNIRHTFINNVYREGVQQDLSILEMAAITGNSYKTANLYYRKYNEIDLYIEAMAKVVITDVDINGEILPIEGNEFKSNVRGDLGSCKSEECVFEIAECLLCEQFVTFLNRIPAFEQEIERNNKKAEKTENQLEIQEINLQKKLLAKYLSEMYKRGGEIERSECTEFIRR